MASLATVNVLYWSTARAIKFEFCAFQEIEQTHFKENRDQLLKTYENMLKKKKEGAGRLKCDMQGYQLKLLKNTPTPHRSECEVRATLVVQHQYFKCLQLLITDIMHYLHSSAFSPHFMYDMLQVVCKFCAVIMQILLEHGMFLCDT
jgi:hypothetical protein